MQDPVTSLVVRLFSAPGVALWLAGGILAFAIGLVIRGGWMDYHPLRSALNDRWNKLSALNLRHLDQTQFPEVDRVFSSTDVPELTEGWLHYRSLLTLQSDGRYATSIHATEAFDHLDDPAKTLEWWSNILVATGLVVTFLGIVAALSEATSTIGQGAVAEGALLGLLAVAATKFWTSIAGVAGSILLRITARHWRRRIELSARLLFTQLDAAVVFLPPEKALLEQLSALNRIETRLEARAS